MPGLPFDSFDLLPFLDKMKSFPIIQLRKFDALLSDIANYVYGISDAINELPAIIGNLDQEQVHSLLSKLTTIQDQSTEIINLLFTMDYDSHSMDRLIFTIRGMKNGIAAVREQLKS